MMENIVNNIKWHNRFIKYLIWYVFKDMTHERCKQLINDDFQALLNSEIEVLKCRDSYFYLLLNSNQILTKSIIKKAYYLLSDFELEEESVNEILKTYLLNNSTKPIRQAINVHLKVLEIIKFKNIEFAFILLNYILRKKGHGILCLRVNGFNQYSKLINEKDISKLTLLFRSNLHQEVCSNSKNEINKIKRKIRFHKKEINEKFKINNLYIYGSYAKKNQTKNSDLDILFYSDKDILYEEYDPIIKYLSNITNKKVDLIKFENAMNKLDAFEMEQVIKIF